MKILIEEKYQQYLQLVNLSEADMSPVQSRETRQAFYAAFGMCLLAMRDEVASIENEDEAVQVMEDMLIQTYNVFPVK